MWFFTGRRKYRRPRSNFRLIDFSKISLVLLISLLSPNLALESNNNAFTVRYDADVNIGKIFLFLVSHVMPMIQVVSIELFCSQIVRFRRMEYIK